MPIAALAIPGRGSIQIALSLWAAKAAGLGEGFSGHSGRAGLAIRMTRKQARSVQYAVKADGVPPAWSTAILATKPLPQHYSTVATRLQQGASSYDVDKNNGDQNYLFGHSF